MAPPSLTRMSFGGPDDTVGYWGQPTSTIDWCERNYVVTQYVAEFWNSISNLFFIVPPLIVCFKLWNKRVERIYLMALVYMAFTGIGSFAFHATLKYEMQLWDELGMVWSAIFVFYIVFKMIYPERATAVIVPTILYGIFANVVYLFLKMPIIFQLAYATLHYSVLFLSYKLMKIIPCDRRLYFGTLIAQHLGFLLWNVDNNFCGVLDTIREVLPASCAPFTQLHAVWHFLAGYGSFALVLYCIHARLLSNNKLFYVSVDHWSGLTLDEDTSSVEKKNDQKNGSDLAKGAKNDLFELVYARQKWSS